MYSAVLKEFIAFQFVAIFSFSLIYLGHPDYISPSLDGFADALYFSVTTWTTLGYGDLKPIVELRLITSAQALLGTASTPVFISLIWLYCQSRVSRTPLDEIDSTDLKLVMDGQFGGLRLTEKDREEFQRSTLNKLNLNDCSQCGSSKIIPEKIYETLGLLSPIPKFLVRCDDCGKFTKPRRLLFSSAWEWNR